MIKVSFYRNILFTSVLMKRLLACSVVACSIVTAMHESSLMSDYTKSHTLQFRIRFGVNFLYLTRGYNSRIVN